MKRFHEHSSVVWFYQKNGFPPHPKGTAEIHETVFPQSFSISLFLDADFIKRTFRDAVVLVFIQIILDRTILRNVDDRALAARVSQSNQETRIPVFRNAQELRHLREFDSTQHSRADAVAVRIQRNRPCCDAHIHISPRIAAAFLADKDESRRLFAYLGMPSSFGRAAAQWIIGCILATRSGSFTST